MERAVLLVRVIVATYLSCWLPVEASACAGIQRQPEPMVGVGPDGKTREFYSASYALIIGEAKYQPDSGWRTLPDVPNDVLRLCDALESHGFVVKTAIDLTAEKLVVTVDQFIRQFGYQVDARILVYFAGHGTTRTFNMSEKDSLAVGYIVPVDGKQANDETFVNSAIRLSQFVEWATATEAKHVMFVFDSCMSGSIFDVLRGESDKSYRQPGADYVFSDAANSRTREFLTSGDATELVPAKSVFLDFFIDAILAQGQGRSADANRDGYLTSGELVGYLKSWVPTAAAQTPQHGWIPNPRLSKGDMIFRLNSPIDPPASTIVSSKDTALIPLYYGNNRGVVQAYRVQTILTTNGTRQYYVNLKIPSSVPEDSVFGDAELACVKGDCASATVNQGPVISEDQRVVSAKLSTGDPVSTWILSAKISLRKATASSSTVAIVDVSGGQPNVVAASVAPILADERTLGQGTPTQRATEAIKALTPRLEAEDRRVRVGARRETAALFAQDPALISEFVRGMPQGSYRYQLGVATALGSVPSWSSNELQASIRILESIHARASDPTLRTETAKALNRAAKSN